MRWLLREWRSGELRLLASALVVAVAIVSGITGFADRLQRGIVQESHQFLAADRVLLSPRPVPAEWLLQAESAGLRWAQVVLFQSMIYAGENMQLASVKAVSSAYPLKGQLRISDQPFGEPVIQAQGPQPGEMWLDSRLFPLLELAPGDTLSLGNLQLPVTQAVLTEPDRGSSYYSFGPRLMLHVDDLSVSGVVQPGSLVRYRYQFAGEPAQLEAFGQWLAPRLEVSHRWQDLRESQPGIAQALERAEHFLLLAGSFGVALAGVAVALAARRYSERHYDVVGVMKALGAQSGHILRLYIGNLMLLTSLATLLGSVLGWGVQELLTTAIRDLMGFVPSAASWRPLLTGAVTALVCVGAFALPPILALQKVSPLRVLRRDITVDSLSAASSVLIGLLGLGGLMWWYAGALDLALAVMAGVVLMMAIVALVVWRLITSSRSLGMQAGSSLRLALAALNRRSRSNAFQVVSFALALMVLLSLLTVRGSLLEEWRLQLPENTPNHFLVNIQPHQVAGITSLLESNDLQTAGLYSMVRGRLTHIDGHPLTELTHIDQNSRSVNRELNLSWAESLPEDNRLTAGQWWKEGARGALPRVSIEQEFAEKLRVGVGSELQFNIGGLLLTAQVSSIRALNWESMRPNFFLLFEPGVLDDYPATVITSFYLPAEKKAFLNELVSAFPTASLIEMDAVIAQTRTIVRQVSSAIELVLGLIIICALLVTVANVQSSLESRLHENAILRALGARRSLIAQSLVLEFALLGLMAGVFAALGSELCLYILQTQVLKMDFASHYGIWLFSPILGAGLIALVGWWSCRNVVRTPPLRVLNAL